ncbi:DMT family transporter [Virgifigura deserti]|uniref:DMT family transporter n=1 Tax=Virgifigura deserti TaxID=2268457 RepID=UPI003CCC19E0
MKRATPARIAPAAAETAARGIMFMLLSVFLFSCMDALIKWMSAGYPLGQIVFFRNLFAFLPVALFLRRAGGIAVLRTEHPGGHLWRAAVGLGAMVCTFASYALMPLPDATALRQSGSLFLTALSVPLLGEKVGVRRWSAVAVGFVGVLIMTRPGAGMFDPAALLAIAGAALTAFAMVAVRQLSRTESPVTIVFYFTLFCTLLSGLSLPFQWLTPSTGDFLLLVAIGLIGGVAQIAMTQAFGLAPVAVVAPFQYSALIFALFFGYVLWDDVPGVFILTGAALVVASGLYILHREAKLRRARTGR